MIIIAPPDSLDQPAINPRNAIKIILPYEESDQKFLCQYLSTNGIRKINCTTLIQR